MKDTKIISILRSRVVTAVMIVAAVAVVGVRLSASGDHRHDTRPGTRAASLDPLQGLKEAWQLVERARLVIYESGERPAPGTIPTFNHARETVSRAEAELAAGRPPEALDLMARAREMLKLAVQVASSEITNDFIEKRLSGIDELRLEAQNLASVCPAPGVRELMGRGDERLQLARQDTKAGRLDYAEAEATIARELYERVIEICAR